jgi:hypothetical protein
MAEQEQRRFYLSEISRGRIHRGCSLNSTHHGFSFDGADDKAIQGLPDLFHHHFPNYGRGQYLNPAQFVYILENDRCDLALISNQLTLVEACTFPDQNLKDFLLSDHLQISASFHQLQVDEQPMRESHHIQRVGLGFPPTPTRLEDQ